MGSSLGEMFAKGGWVMWPLLLLSVISWAVILERIYTYLTVRPRLLQLAQSLLQSLKTGDVQAAKQLCLSQKTAVGEVFLPALDRSRSREATERVTERRKIEMATYLRRNLWILGTIGSASPFIGLLGTVVGIIRAFHDMAHKGTGGFSVVAGGISEALIATGAGLVVAIVSLLSYNAFVTVSNQTASRIKLSLDEIIDSVFEPQQTST